jgi:hypothetical protein
MNMPTLWQMLTKKVKGGPPPKTKVVSNPLNAKIQSSVQFDVLDYRDMTFFVQDVREMSRIISGKNFPFVDYTLLARPLGKDDVLVRLRLMPVTNPQPGDDLTHNTILMTKWDEFGYNADFREVVSGDDFRLHQDGTEIARFWRINDVKSSYDTTAKIVNSTNEKTEGSFITELVEYWDYWREFNDEAGLPTKEYLFVEINKEDGFTTIWKGQEINARRVDVR